MAPHTDWKDTSAPAFAVEDAVAKEFGLVRNPDIKGTDLYNSSSGTFVEIKSIGSPAIEYVVDEEGRPLGPKYMYFQITRKAQLNDENNWFPVVRPGGVFRTCQDTPNSLLVVRSPEKNFHDYFTSRAVTIPQRTYYYKAHQLMMKLISLIYTNQLKVHRLYHCERKYKFETVVKVEFETLRDIELGYDEFVEHTREGCPGMSKATAKELWTDVVHRYSFPCLRKVKLYERTFAGYLSMDPAPVWRTPWWRGK